MRSAGLAAYFHARFEDLWRQAVETVDYLSWDELLTDDAVQYIADAASIDPDEIDPETRGRLASILSLAGGLPVVAEPFDAAERTGLAVRLLEEASGHAVGAHLGAPSNGWAGGGPDGYELVAVPRIPVNFASSKELEALPLVGEALGKAIQVERESGGA